MEPKQSSPSEIESLDSILSIAKKLTSEVDILLSSSLPTKDQNDHHRVTITSFWIITSIMAHTVYATITDLSSIIKSFDVDLQRKMELDFVALNIINHDLYDLSRLYLALFRVLTVKNEDHHRNQHIRLLDYVIDKSECIQRTSCLYLDRLSTAIGHKAGDHEMTAGVHNALKSVGFFTRIVSQLRSMILMAPLQKFTNFTHTNTGRSLLQWLATTLKLVVKNAAPPLLSGVLEQVVTSLHPIEMLNRRQRSGPVNTPPNGQSEFKTLAKVTGDRNDSAMM